MLAWLAYLTVAVVWGSTYFAIALSLESFTPFGMVAVRFSAASLLALGLGRLRREPWPARRQIGHLTLVGALLLGISNPLVAWAELHLSSGLAAILSALVPLWLALFSVAKEPLGPKGWTGLLLGLAGVAVLVCQRFIQNQYTALFPADWGTDLTCRDLEPALAKFWAGLKR